MTFASKLNLIKLSSFVTGMGRTGAGRLLKAFGPRVGGLHADPYRARSVLENLARGSKNYDDFMKRFNTAFPEGKFPTRAP